MTDKNRVYIFDTTMRDGEQSPGASMSLEEKIQIARVFDELGIDIIEAGFPIASPGDFEATAEVSKILKNSIRNLQKSIFWSTWPNLDPTWPPRLSQVGAKIGQKSVRKRSRKPGRPRSPFWDDF